MLAPAALSAAAPNLDLDRNLSLSLDLRLTAEPTQVEPGDVLTYTATVANAGDTPLTAVVLTDTLPDGLVYVAQSAVGFAYDSRAGQLTWAVGMLAPGATLTGSFQARVQGLALGVTVTNTVLAGSPARAEVLTASAVVDIVPPRNDVVWVTPNEGGLLRSTDDRLLLRIPPGAVQAGTRFSYAGQPALPRPLTGLRFAFTVEAQDASGQPQHRFAAPLVLTLAYRPDEFPAAAGLPVVYYFDETTGQWMALPTQVDRQRRQLQVAVSHLTLFAAATSGFTYGIQDLPTIHGFVSDAWSGNSSVSYPLTLPPGPGGLDLGLALTYSSEGVNAIRQPSDDGRSDYDKAQRFDRQASIVGWGWSLTGLGQITVQGPPEGSGNRLWLSFAGGSYELKYSSGAWQTEPQGFLRIEHTGNYAEQTPWYIWTPDGTKYTFGGASGTAASWHQHGGPDYTCSLHARELHLTEVRDPHGNVITVTYAVEPESVTCYDDQGNPKNTVDYQRAIRPVRMEYFPNGPLATARVDFTYLEGRSDTGVSALNPLYTTYRLTTITAGVRTGSGADAFTTARSYALTNTTYATDQLYNRRLMLLTAITENGRDGGARPAWTFTYTLGTGTPLDPPGADPVGGEWFNHTLLLTADNGQGGKVTYSYEGSGLISIGFCSGNTVRFRVQKMTAEDGLGSAAPNKIETAYEYGASYSWAEAGDCAKNWEFGGYALVRRIVKDGAGAVYQVMEDSYHQCGSASPAQACGSGNETKDARRGKPYLSSTRSAVGSDPLAHTATTWSSQLLNGTPWVYAADATSTLGASSQKTAYAYQTANQNGTQYGNVTHVREYSDAGATLARTRERWYYPKNVAGGAYIVNRLAQEKLWQGDVGGSCQAQTRYIYDNPSNSWTTLPTVGDLVKQRQETSICDDTGTDAGWVTSFYGYDGWGNHIAITDTLGRVTTTAYDTSGNWPKLYAYPISETLPAVNGLNLTTVYTWDKVLGQVTSVTDPNAVVTSYVYDEFGRQIKLIKPGDDTTNPTVKLSYNNYAGVTAPYWVKQEQRDNLSSAPPATYLESRTYYDGLGRTVQTQGEVDGSMSSIVSLKYNPLGVVQATAPYTHTQALGVGGNYRTPVWSQPSTYTTYDALGRSVQVIQPDNSLVRTYYQDRKTAAIDPLNHQTIQEADTFGRLINARQYEGTYAGAPNWGAAVYAQAQYQYDVADRLKQVLGADTATTTLTYDLAGRKTGMSDPDMGSWSYAYDAAGNLLRQTDAKNQRLCFYYDALNRLKGKTYSTGTTTCPADPGYTGYAVKYYYDKDENGNAVSNGKGRRTVMIDPSGNTRWLYDTRGRVTQETRVISGTGGGTFVTKWDYDAADRVVWQKYPGGANGEIGEQVNTTYTGQGLLRQVQSNGGVYYVGDTLYNVRGQVRERRLGNTVGVVKQLYDYAATENFRLTAFRSGITPNYNTLQNVTYSYDDAGNVLSIIDTAAYNGPPPTPPATQTQSFSYDALHRLATAAATGGSYGTYSQRSYQYSNAGNLTNFEGSAYAYNDAAHKHGVTHIGGVQKYWYDANGSVTQRTSPWGTTIALAYNAENRLIGVSGAVTETHVYDGDGQRVKTTITTTVSTTTVYVGNYYEVQGSTVKKYYYAGNVRVAENNGGTLYFLLSDHLGSTATTTDATGVRATELRYYPYGDARYNPGSQITTFRFTGQRWDSGSGLYFYNARWYDPLIGRFLQADTIVPQPGNPQALNRYSYVGNNPLKYTDPTGMFSEDQLVGWYGKDWRSLFTPEWQQLLLDVPDSQILGAQLGDLVLYGDDPSALSQGVLVLGPSGELALWDPTSKSSTSVASIGQTTPGQLGLYRIAGGETGAADERYGYLTGGTQFLPATNGLGYGPSTMAQLATYSPRNQGLPTQTTLAADWFMGVNGAGYYVHNHSQSVGLQQSPSSWFALAIDGAGIIDMLVVGTSPFAAGVTGFSTIWAYYQAAKYRNSYEMRPCSPNMGVNWCRE